MITISLPIRDERRGPFAGGSTLVTRYALMSRSADFPSPEVALALHERLLAGDRLATGDICTTFLDPLLRFLTARHPRDDPHLLLTAINTALIDYLQRPTSYDPDRHADLGAYLRMAASADRANLRQSDYRRERHFQSVELVESERNHSSEDGPLLRLYRAEEEDETRRLIDDIADDPTDAEIMWLLLEGVRATAAFAAVMGISHLFCDEQARLVKCAKDRLIKRAQRYKRHA